MRKYIKFYTAVILLVSIVSVSALLLARKSSAEIQTVSPQEDAVDISISTTITVTFFDNKNNCNTDGTLTLTKRSDSTVVTTTSTYDNGSDTATFTPDSYLEYEEIYDVDFDLGAVSQPGTCAPDVLDVRSWSFTTEDDPTAVILSDLSVAADPVDGKPVVHWETAMEINTLGFNILRSRYEDTDYHQVNTQFIPAQSIGGVFGASYDFKDTTKMLQGKTYYYMLEEIEVGGRVLHYGPVIFTSEGPNVLPWLFPWEEDEIQTGPKPVR